jgi:hypothetical protein
MGQHETLFGCLHAGNSSIGNDQKGLSQFVTAFISYHFQDIKEWLVILMDKVYNNFCNINDLVVVNEMLSILSAFFILLESEPTRIPPILDLLKRLLLTTDTKIENGSTNNESYELISLKRHCINLLLKLVTTLPAVIKVSKRRLKFVTMYFLAISAKYPGRSN